MNRIRWFVDPAMDIPELRSPQPCTRGIACDYMRKNAEGVLEKAWCKFVHPGEEGNGRSIWAEKRLEDGTVLPAVVRLSGQHTAAGGGWVQRLKERLCWSDWAAKHGLQADTSAGPLEIERIGGARGTQVQISSPLNPEHQSSQSHRRRLHIDLGSGASLPDEAASASVIQLPAQFPPMEHIPQPQPPQPQPPQNLSHYEREHRAGWRGPVAVATARARTAATPVFVEPFTATLGFMLREESQPPSLYEDGCSTPCLTGTGENCGEGEMDNVD